MRTINDLLQPLVDGAPAPSSMAELSRRVRLRQRRRRVGIAASVILMAAVAVASVVHLSRGGSGVVVRAGRSGLGQGVLAVPNNPSEASRLLLSSASVAKVVPGPRLRAYKGGGSYGVMSNTELAASGPPQPPDQRGPIVARLGVTRQWIGPQVPTCRPVGTEPCPPMPDIVATVVSVVEVFDSPAAAQISVGYTASSAFDKLGAVRIPLSNGQPADLVAFHYLVPAIGPQSAPSRPTEYVGTFSDGPVMFVLQMTANSGRDTQFVRLVQAWLAELAPKTTTSVVTSCSATNLNLALANVDAAAGSTISFFTLTNKSDAACALGGYPAVGLGDDHGVSVPLIVIQGGNFPGLDALPTTVDLRPGASASFMLQTSAALNPPCFYPKQVVLSISGGTVDAPVNVSDQTIYVCGSLVHVSALMASTTDGLGSPGSGVATSALQTPTTFVTSALTVNPSRGPVGTRIAITGRGFGARTAHSIGDLRQSVYLHRYDAQGHDLLAMLGVVSVAPDGSFSLTADVPATIGVRQQGVTALAPGDYQFVVGPTANLLPSPVFTVTVR
jgi:hypothetical protein